MTAQSTADCVISALTRIEAIGDGMSDDHPMRHVVRGMRDVAERIITDAMRRAEDIARTAKYVLKDHDDAIKSALEAAENKEAE